MKNSATYPMEITKTQQEKIDKTKPNWIHQYKIVGFLTIQYRNVRQKEVRVVVEGHLENICILGCEKKIICENGENNNHLGFNLHLVGFKLGKVGNEGIVKN